MGWIQPTKLSTFFFLFKIGESIVICGIQDFVFKVNEGEFYVNIIHDEIIKWDRLNNAI